MIDCKDDLVEVSRQVQDIEWNETTYKHSIGGVQEFKTLTEGFMIF